MTTKDGKYFITTIGEDGKEHTYPLKYVLGGVWKQRYITEFPNGGLHVLRFSGMWTRGLGLIITALPNENPETRLTGAIRQGPGS